MGGWRTCRAVGHDPVTLRLPPVLRGRRAQFPHAVPHRQPPGGVTRKASARGALPGAAKQGVLALAADTDLTKTRDSRLGLPAIACVSNHDPPHPHIRPHKSHTFSPTSYTPHPGPHDVTCKYDPTDLDDFTHRNRPLLKFHSGGVLCVAKVAQPQQPRLRPQEAAKIRCKRCRRQRALHGWLPVRRTVGRAECLFVIGTIIVAV